MNRTSSYINADRKVENNDRKPMADSVYVAAMVRLNGELVPALFTVEQIQVAVDRADRDTVDCPVAAWTSVPDFLDTLFEGDK